MNQVFADEQLPKILSRMLDPDVTYRLFVNDVTPDGTETPASFTEASWTGYSAVSVALAEWIDSGVAGGVDLWIHAPIAFANSSGSDQQAYGYFVLDSDGDLLCAARFDGAPLTRADGQVFFVIPTMGDFSSEL
jgi:hypothetical protein